MGPLMHECESLIYRKEGWFYCGRPGEFVTFPRTMPMWLCPHHKAETEKVRSQQMKSIYGRPNE